ncbi:unnamed protein product [Rhizophagus irregularis]|nr:unnamed protein product [Rhizophagus irregularis]
MYFLLQGILSLACNSDDKCFLRSAILPYCPYYWTFFIIKIHYDSLIDIGFAFSVLLSYFLTIEIILNSNVWLVSNGKG